MFTLTTKVARDFLLNLYITVVKTIKIEMLTSKFYSIKNYGALNNSEFCFSLIHPLKILLRT